MPHPAATLHLVCGKVAAGKSTLCAELGEAPHTVVIAEDALLSALYGDQMTTLEDYARCAGRLRAAIAVHVVALLRAGVGVVLDFPANTVETRAWMRGLAQNAETESLLHFLDVPDEVCKARLRARNTRGDHPFAVTEAEFARLAQHFVPPSEAEGFKIVRHGI